MAGIAQVLSKTMDSTTLTTDKVELATISRDEADGGRVRNASCCKTSALAAHDARCFTPSPVTVVYWYLHTDHIESQ